MNFITPTMATNKNKTNDDHRKRLRPNSPSPATSDDDTVQDRSLGQFASFLLVEAANADRPLNLSVFAIQKILLAAVGTVRSAKKLRSGAVLVEVATKAQYDLAMKMHTWIDIPVKVSEHRSLNSSRGVIRCRDFKECDESEVLDALRTQGVTAVKQIKTRRDGVLKPTGTFILTFNTHAPPQSVKAAYLSIAVDQYIPNPLRCYNCQHYGHGKSSCSRPEICAKCGGKGHSDNGCSNDLHCCNCGGSHGAFSKDCPEWQRQQKISRIKVERNISFPEAAKIVDTSGNTSHHKGKSYAQAVRAVHSVKSVEVQTDLTWPLHSKVPVLATETQQTATSDAAVNTTTAGSSQNIQQTSSTKPPPSANPKPTVGPNKLTPPSAKSKPSSTNRQSKATPNDLALYNRYGKLSDDTVVKNDTPMDTSQVEGPSKSSKNLKS